MSEQKTEAVKDHEEDARDLKGQSSHGATLSWGARGRGPTPRPCHGNTKCGAHTAPQAGAFLSSVLHHRPGHFLQDHSADSGLRGLDDHGRPRHEEKQPQLPLQNGVNRDG